MSVPSHGITPIVPAVLDVSVRMQVSVEGIRRVFRHPTFPLRLDAVGRRRGDEGARGIFSCDDPSDRLGVERDVVAVVKRKVPAGSVPIVAQCFLVLVVAGVDQDARVRG